jgi:L-ribulose-5-phosphate 3-epimerase
MKNDKWNIGVCSWSLKMDIVRTASFMRETGISHVHLALGPAVGEDGGGYLADAQRQDWTISCTMLDFPQEDYSSLDSIRETGGIVPDQSWDFNKSRFSKAARMTAELGVKYISLHAGFIDHGDPARYKIMCERVCTLADIAAEQGIMLLLETGQESAAELESFMNKINHPATGINFDPANMILYGKGDPVEGVTILAKWIRHVHIKDALASGVAGQWGTEVPWGQGQVGAEKFLSALQSIGYEGTLAIEREAGDDRCSDVKLAVNRLKQYL